MPLEVCPFCERLYSTHSLPLHLPRCNDNPKPPSGRKDAGKKTTSREELKEPQRPSTRSLSRNKPASYRVCYICGNGFSENDLFDHEEQCLREWHQTAEHLPAFVTKRPKKVWHPSVDGTRDVTRQNALATEQSRSAQRAKCRSCGVVVSFWQAVDHICRTEPEVQFFIQQRA